MLPVIVELGPFTLYGYGLMCALGIALGFRTIWRRRERVGLKDDASFWALVNVLTLMGFAGGRVLYLLQYARGTPDFRAALVSTTSGFSVFGGIISLILSVWVFARWKKLDVLVLADAVFAAGCLAHAFGRMGCFLAGCCYGKPTGLPWGVAFTNPRSMVPAELLGVRLHPAQLYEAAADLAFASVLLRMLDLSDEGRVERGTTAAAYFAFYGALRFGLEFVRDDGVPFAFGLTGGQGLGLALLLTGAALYGGRKACARSC